MRMRHVYVVAGVVLLVPLCIWLNSKAHDGGAERPTTARVVRDPGRQGARERRKRAGDDVGTVLAVPTAVAPAGDASVPTSPPPASALVIPDGSGVDVVVMDLATATAVDGLDVVVYGKAQPARSGSQAATESVLRSVTASGGHILLPAASDAVRIGSVGAGWTALAQPYQEVLDGRRLWVFRTLRVVGRVRKDGAVPGETRLDDIDVHRIFVGIDGAAVTAPTPEPWAWRWLQARGVTDAYRAGRTDATGRFELDVPAVRGAVVQVSAAGYRAASVEIQLPPVGTSTVEVDLVMQPAVRVHGVARRSDGRPLANALVALYVRDPLDARHPNTERLRLSGHKLKAAVDAKTGASTVYYVIDTLTSEDGSFELFTNVEGDTLLTMHSQDGVAPTRMDLGRVRANLRDLNVEAAPVAGAGTAAITVDGEGVAGHRVSFADLSVGPAQPTAYVFAGDASRVPTHLWEKGHEYMIIVEPLHPATVIDKPAFVRVVWDGQTAIDVPNPDRKR